MSKKFLIFPVLAAMAIAQPAQAGTKFLGLMWWPSHWYNQDFQPYYEDSIGPHNSQWDSTYLNDKNWTPQEWVAADGGNGFELIRKWYVADIIRDQYVTGGGKPYIVVGPNFYHLGGADKERVMQTVDAVYKVTDYSPGMFYLEDFRTDKVVGIYSKSGLDLQ